MVDNQPSGRVANSSTRRRFIQGAGATGVVGLAGCLGDGGGDGGGGDDSGGSSGDDGTEGGSTGGDDGDVELSVWTLFGGGDGEAFQSIVESYNEQDNGITLNVQRIEWSQYYGKLFTALTGGTPPDIAIVHTTRMLKYNDAVVDLSPYLSDGAQDAYIQSVWDKSQVEGKRSGLPLDMHPTGFYYNKDIFDEAGVSGTPSNWEEWTAACNSVADAGYAAFNPQPYAGPSHLRSWFQWHRQRGGRILNEDKTKAAFDTDAGIELTREWGKMTSEYGWDEPDASGDRGTQMFRNGKLGIINQGTWYIGALQDVDFEWGLFKPYTAPGKQQGAAWSNSHTLAVPKKSGRSDAKTQAAVEAIEYITQDGGKDWGTIAGHLPASASANKSDTLRQSNYWDKTLSTFYDIAQRDEMVYLPRHKKLQEFKRPLFKNIQQVYSQQKDAEQAIKDAATEINGSL